ncbi:MAG: 2-oxo acid dehydrogenase subunit E2 [Gemmataceae bacterium]|nr:2-oxo acid dehydrogenase subunit E2 [Gemmataceae bacterium]
MATDVLLPPPSEDIKTVKIVKLMVKVGDTVQTGTPLMEIESGKAAMEVPSPADGKVSEVLVAVDQEVPVGAKIAVIANGEASNAAPPPSQPKPAVDTQTVEKSVSQTDEPPANTPMPKPAAPAPAAAPPKQTPAAAQPKGNDEVVHAGPATRRLAREWGVELGNVAGSGVKGRVTQDDVKTFVRTAASGGGAAAAAGGVIAPKLPDFEKWGAIDYKSLDGIRVETAKHMSLCWQTIPHVTQHDNADVTDIEAFRKQQADKGGKLTVTAFVLKAASIVLRQFPQFNSSLDWDNKRLVLKQYCHIGIAVDTPNGLVVPVLRDVDKKSVYDIGKEMTEAAEKARDRKLGLKDMQGGTFTISNLGGIGGTSFTPIVNWPEVAILGLSRSKMQPVWKDGQFVPRLQMPMSLSYDHRVIDGADAARFVRRLAELLENPMVMLLHA